MKILGSPVPESQRDRLADSLRQLAKAKGPGAKLPTVREIMATYGVSQSTVAGALTLLSDERIVERRDRSGIYVCESVREQRLIILCETEMFLNGSPFWKMFLKEIISRFEGTDVKVTVHFLTPMIAKNGKQLTEDLLIPEVRDQIMSGYYGCVVSIGGSEYLIDEFEAVGVPVVSFAVASRYIVNSATLDSWQLGVTELLKRGCQRIALFNTPSIATRELMMILIEAHGAEQTYIPYDEEWAHESSHFMFDRQPMERGFKAAQWVLKQNPMPDGVLIAEDLYTVGFCSGLVREGHVPGKDFEIVTHCNKNSPLLLAWEDQINRIEMDVAELAAPVASAVKDLMDNRRPEAASWSRALRADDQETFHIFVRLKLIPRSV